MNDAISVRLANEQDIQAILELSKGIYDGRDYLPHVINQWFETKAKYMFVAEVQGKVIGFQSATIVDGGQTIFCQSLRIHREYRGRGYSYQTKAGAIDCLLRIKPGATKVRHLVEQTNIPMIRVSEKMGYKTIMERRVCRLEDVPRRKSITFQSLGSSHNGELHELGLEDALEFILIQRKFDLVFPHKTVMVTRQAPFQLLKENAELIFKVGDKMFTDLSTDDMRRDLIPKSFSHGRRVIRVDWCSWACHIYTSDRGTFKAHLIRQMVAAIEQLDQREEKTQVEVLYPPNLDFDVEELFKEVLGLEQDGIVIDDASTMVYEKDL